MLRRCTDTNHKMFYRYGGRGISFDPRWASFEEFAKDMGERPEGTTLDRKDSDRDYSKENCKWSGRKEQMGNRKGAAVMVIAGLALSQAEWSELIGIRSDVIRKRLRMGWPPSEAVLAPVSYRASK